MLVTGGDLDRSVVCMYNVCNAVDHTTSIVVGLPEAGSHLSHKRQLANNSNAYTGARCTTSCPLQGTRHTGHLSVPPSCFELAALVALPLPGVLAAAAARQREQYKKCMQGMSTVSFGRSKQI